MNAKHRADGSPNVLYLQSALDEFLGKDRARTILPITDPYVVHHGALGSYATVYLPADAAVGAAAAYEKGLEGVERALTRAEPAAAFALPADRIGDLLLMSGNARAVGTSPDQYSLPALDLTLRAPAPLRGPAG